MSAPLVSAPLVSAPLVSAPLVVYALEHFDKHGASLEGVCATRELARALAQGQSRAALEWRASRAPNEGRLGRAFAGYAAQEAAQAKYERLGPIDTATEPDGYNGAIWCVVPTEVMTELPADLESWRTA